MRKLADDGLDQVVKAAGFDPSTPRATVIKNLTAECERLTKRVKELEAAKDPLALIQKAHQSGGKRLYP